MKINNSIEAKRYKDKLISVLNQYRIFLFTDGVMSEAIMKQELILMFIDFQYQFHKVSKMNEATMAEISQKFVVHLKNQNKPEDYLSEHKKIIRDFFEFIIENHKPKST